MVQLDMDPPLNTAPRLSRLLENLSLARRDEVRYGRLCLVIGLTLLCIFLLVSLLALFLLTWRSFATKSVEFSWGEFSPLVVPISFSAFFLIQFRSSRNHQRTIDRKIFHLRSLEADSTDPRLNQMVALYSEEAFRHNDNSESKPLQGNLPFTFKGPRFQVLQFKNKN